MGYRTYVAVQHPTTHHAPRTTHHAASATIESPFLSAKLDPARGIISSLVDKRSGRELAGSTDGLGLGQYLYERFDNDRVSHGARTTSAAATCIPTSTSPNQPPSDQ